LIDEIGGETEARAWLSVQHNVGENLPVRDVRLGGLRERLLGDDAEGVFSGLLKSLLTQRVSLDGAVSVWQPSLTRD
jgi:protease-4